MPGSGNRDVDWEPRGCLEAGAGAGAGTPRAGDSSSLGLFLGGVSSLEMLQFSSGMALIIPRHVGVKSEVRSFTTAHHEQVLVRGRFLRLYVIYKINLIHINVCFQLQQTNIENILPGPVLVNILFRHCCSLIYFVKSHI